MNYRKSCEELFNHFKRELDDSTNETRQDIVRLESKLNDLIRYTIHQKWASSDACAENTERIIRCRICDFEDLVSTYETVESSCIFNGGRLLRYICPQCGAIFGPSKMLDLTPSGMNEEYRIHYSIYEEGDSTDKELKAFYSLNPVPEGKYLIYGCGEWSHTIEHLLSQGFDVEGFDPYVKESDHVITDFNVLMQRRYDGIMTNNLIEHLTDPVDAFRLFRSLLSGPYSLMAHSTPCYEYSFEYTRFHLFFFTGNSIDVLCKKCELKVETVERDPEHDFINYVYSIAEKDCMDRMHTMHHCEFIDDHGKKGIVAYPGGIIYGPYINLLKGSYKLELMCEFKGNPRNTELAITKNSGQLIENHMLQNGFNVINFDLDDYARDIEFVVRNDGMDYFKLTSVVLKR